MTEIKENDIKQHLKGALEKLIGSKKNLNNIIKQIKKDKKFMEKYMKEEYEYNKFNLLKEKIEQINEEQFKEINRFKKAKIKSIIKKFVILPSSYGYKGTEKKIIETLSKEEIKNLLDNRITNEKGFKIRKYTLDFNNSLSKIAFNDIYYIHLEVFPNWKRHILDSLKKILKTEDNLEAIRIRENMIKELYNNKSNFKEEDLSYVLQVIVDRITLPRKEDGLKELNQFIKMVFKNIYYIKLEEKGDIINFEFIKDSPLAYLYDLYVKIYNGDLEKDRKDDFKRKEENKLKILEEEEEKVFNFNGSYYIILFTGKDGTKIIDTKIKRTDKGYMRYENKAIFIKQLLEYFVEYLLSIEYLDLQGNIHKLFTSYEIQNIVSQVLAELSKLGVVKQDKQNKKDSIDKVIEKIKRAEKLIDKKKIKFINNNGNIEVIVGRGEDKNKKQLKEEFMNILDDISANIKEDKKDELDIIFKFYFKNKENQEFEYFINIEEKNGILVKSKHIIKSVKTGEEFLNHQFDLNIKNENLNIENVEDLFSMVYETLINNLNFSNVLKVKNMIKKTDFVDDDDKKEDTNKAEKIDKKEIKQNINIDINDVNEMI